ncbi:hypothetical protein K491DRAFT_495044 [Lophiostoma macrostomum CBS 122681]|uniref:Uncharacterized protein n=1 Tax=Lophiostoma macrostomum CBS 122681 TaxID=1314788 RepID=A0A6A6T5X3_9PLEO|nr:hypothetical protein K491DRAFT_495044 [Lophiostoma macrostomum CBS 122681]
MADLQQELSVEITRIIGCPWSPSLTKLASLLERAGDDTICECLRDRPPCAIARLAGVVADQLAQHAHTVRVLQGFCHSLDFREHFLQQCPGALDALLIKANTSQHAFEEVSRCFSLPTGAIEATPSSWWTFSRCQPLGTFVSLLKLIPAQYSQSCCQLLSAPLPEGVVLPASTQAFFLRVFETAPSVLRLKQIYAMLDGACSQLLSCLSADARQSFDEELHHIICKTCVRNDLRLWLYAFGVAVLIERLNDSVHHEWRTKSGQKLFGSLKNVHKTLQLTYLNVVWVFNKDCDISAYEAAEGIRIATRVILPVDKSTREKWPTSDRIARGIFPKLPEKVLRENIDPVVQIEALCFYATIAGEDNLPADIVAQYEATLLELSRLQMNMDKLRETLSDSLPVYAPQLKPSTICQLLAQILHSSASTTNTQDLCSATVLVEQMAALIPRHEHVRRHMLAALSSDQFQGHIASFLECDPGHDAVGPESPGCQTTIKIMRRKLMASTISMLLTLALTVQPTEPRLPGTLAIALIKKQQRLPQLPNACMHNKANMPPAVAFFEQASTPSTGSLRQNWKDRLCKELEMQNLYQRDSIIRSVAQVCHDLEDRCDTVEEPLRLEQAKVRDLTNQVDELREEVDSLQTKATDQQFRQEGLEVDYANVEEEKSELVSRLASLEAKFDHAKRKADDKLRAAREEFDAKESKLESTVTDREKEMHLYSVRIAEMDTRISQLQDEVHAKEREVELRSDSQDKLRSELGESRQALEAERSTVSQQMEEIAKLQEAGNELEHQLSCSKNEVTTLTDQYTEISTRYRALEASSRQELQDMEAQCEQELDSAATKASEEYEKLHGQLQDALHNTEQVNSAYEQTRRDLESAQTAITSLEVKVQHLSKDCAEKEEELEELRPIQKAILAMRPQGRNRQQLNDLDRPQKTPRQTRRRKSTRHPEEDLHTQVSGDVQGITHTAMESVANASFSSSDSFSRTPKRQKPRPTFKIPAMHTPHGQKLGVVPKLLSHRSAHAKRPALRAVSPNRRHTTVGVAFEQIEEKEGGEKKRSSLHLYQQGSFDMDNFLASTPMPFTPGHIVSGTGREPTEEQEETTEL